MEEIEEKIKRGKILEHPSYEDYLEAISPRDNMKEAVEGIRRIADALEAGTG